MKKPLKLLLIIFMGIMICIFLNLFSHAGISTMDTKNILSGTSHYSLMLQKIIFTLFLGTMLCVPIAFTKSKIVAYTYCAIVLNGTIIGKLTFWGYLSVVLSVGGLFFGAGGELISWIIRLFLPNFNVIWIIWIFQILGHIVTLLILTYPYEALKMIGESKDSSKSCNHKYSSMDLCNDLLEYEEKSSRIRREKETLETLKDIDYHLRNK